MGQEFIDKELRLKDILVDSELQSTRHDHDVVLKKRHPEVGGKDGRQDRRAFRVCEAVIKARGVLLAISRLVHPFHNKRPALPDGLPACRDSARTWRLARIREGVKASFSIPSYATS